MMAFTRRAIVCILIVTGIALCGRAQSTSPKEPAATISGKVTFKGEAVQGVVITLRSNDDNRRLTNHRGVTDAKGEYRIANVPPGNYAVIPAASAFVSEDESKGERTLMVNAGETIENLDFSLIRGGVITGKVVDADGRPLIEEEVHLMTTRNPGMRSPRPAAITDDRGVYRIFALRPGNYTVAAGKDDIGASSGRRLGAVYSRTYYPGIIDPAQATAIQVSDGSEATNVDIVLGRKLTTYTASGRVVNGATGQPIPNVPYGVVQFVSPTYTVIMGLPAVTNSEGEFKLEHLIPGKYAVSLRPEQGSEWRAEDLRFEIGDEDVTGLVVKTSKGSSMSGRVVVDGIADKAITKQLRKARLIVSVASESARSFGGSAFRSTVGPDGSFFLPGLTEGTATFSFADALHFRILRIERDGIIQAHGIEVKQGEDIKTVRIVVGYADASVRGTITIENGTIPPNGRFFLWARKTNDPANIMIDGSRQIDARGQFVLENMLPGTYELTTGVLVRGSRAPLMQTKQEIVVTANSITNTTMKLNLNSPQPNP